AEWAAAETALAALVTAAALAPLTPARWQRRDCPNRTAWQALVEQVTAPAALALTPKVVLSRQTQLTACTPAAPLCPWQLLKTWRASAPKSFHFGFAFSPQHTFIACSPERLYRRLGLALASEALAGTTARTGDVARDNALADALLHDAKNLHENALVQADILRQLTPLTTQVDIAPPQILQLARLQHLHCSISGELRAGVSDSALLAALHPTPAVGGAPRQAALAFLRAHEPYARGWYAGACGMLTAQAAEFSVAIRSALVEPAQLTLFAGAGIVQGSQAEAEWAELDNKISHVLALVSA
ncbi:MAG: isochorismate synthase, partial [Aeromonas sp.]